MDRPKKLQVVRLRSSIDGSYLVACPDKKTVAHVSLGSSGSGLTSIENALWVVTRYPDSRNDGNNFFCLTSVYGKSLTTVNKGGDVFQMEAPKNDISHTIRWRIEKTEKETHDVCVKACPDQNDGDELYLMAMPDTRVVALAKLFWPFTWMFKWASRWVVEDAGAESAVKFVQQLRNHSLQMSGTPSVLVGQLIVNNLGAGSGSSSYNSGRNNNYGSGTQISGDVNVRTEIGRQDYTVNFISK